MPVVSGAEVGGVDVGVELDLVDDPLLVGRLLEVGQDLLGGGDGGGGLPDLPGEAEGVHVAVRPGQRGELALLSFANVILCSVALLTSCLVYIIQGDHSAW